MAIDVQHAVPDDEAALNTDINTTPLVDVMLVMLIIFLVTIPVIVKSIPVQLPTYRNVVTQTKPENIVIAVDLKENMYVNNNETPITEADLRTRLVDALKDAVAKHKSLPEVHIRGDKNVRFEAVGRVILVSRKFISGATRMCASRRWAASFWRASRPASRKSGSSPSRTCSTPAATDR